MPTAMELLPAEHAVTTVALPPQTPRSWHRASATFGGGDLDHVLVELDGVLARGDVAPHPELVVQHPTERGADCDRSAKPQLLVDFRDWSRLAPPGPRSSRSSSPRSAVQSVPGLSKSASVMIPRSGSPVLGGIEGLDGLGSRDAVEQVVAELWNVTPVGDADSQAGHRDSPARLLAHAACSRSVMNRSRWLMLSKTCMSSS